MYDSPIDNQTYNLLQILTSKLEAVEAYNIYEEDMEGEAAKLVNRIAADDRRHVEELARHLGLAR
jgi:rubrerythrin